MTITLKKRGKRKEQKRDNRTKGRHEKECDAGKLAAALFFIRILIRDNLSLYKNRVIMNRKKGGKEERGDVFSDICSVADTQRKGDS